MFLIEYSENRFINGENIQWLKLGVDEVMFSLKSDNEVFSVDSKLQEAFVNNLQAINDNINSVEKAYLDIGKQANTVNN